MTQLQEALAHLDLVLTGKPEEDVVRSAERQAATVETVMSKTYYLADGGYSRVGLGENKKGDGLVLFLDSVSRKEVKRRWNECLEEVETALMAAEHEIGVKGRVF